MKKILIIILLLFFYISECFGAAGDYSGMVYGPIGGTRANIFYGGATTALATLNAGVGMRFMSNTTLDIKAVKVNWSSVSSPGAVKIRIETIDATTGNPSGTLYDANAELTSQTPVAGVQTYTFGTLPTTGLTIGTEYAVVIITTTGGTTQTLSSYCTALQGAYPANLLTTSDAGTSWTGSSGAIPIVSFILEDDSETFFNCLGFYTFANNYIYSTTAAAAKMVIKETLSIEGINAVFSKTGTPAGDLRCRIYASGDLNPDNPVANTTVTIDKDSLNATGKQVFFPFSSLVSLTAGTYYVVFDSAPSVNSSNCFSLRVGTPFSSTYGSASFKRTIPADVTANPMVFTDDTTGASPAVGLVVDDITIPASGGGGAYSYAF